VSTIGDWLASLGLSQYAQAFESNDIGMDLVSEVNDQTLKDLGVSSAGHRLRILRAITRLSAQASTGPIESSRGARFGGPSCFRANAKPATAVGPVSTGFRTYRLFGALAGVCNGIADTREETSHVKL
jgi:SAM domain (Sterile alpha motif)